MKTPSYIKRITEFDDSKALDCLKEFVEEYEIIRLCKDKNTLDKMRFDSDKSISPYFLITGQFVVDFLFANRFDKPTDYVRIPHVNDIDIFNLKYSIPHTETDSEFELVLPEIDNYGEISGAHYRITSSIKINYFLKNSNFKINFVDASENLFSEYSYKDFPDRMKYFAKNILGFFDLNVNQVGLFINVETNEMKFLYTKAFKNFVKSKQIELNPLNSTVGRIARAFYKYYHLSKLDSSTRSTSPYTPTKYDTFYLDQDKIYKYLCLIYGYYKKFINKTCLNCSQEKIQQVDNAFSTAFRKMIVTKYGLIEKYFQFLLDKIFNKLEKSEIVVKDNLSIKIMNNINIDYKESFINDSNKFVKNATIESDMILGKFYERVLEDAENIDSFIENVVLQDIATAALLEVNLQAVSKKKLKAAIDYFNNRNGNYLTALFMIVGQEFKLLNRNVSDLFKVSKFIYQHDIFGRMYVSYYDQMAMFDFMLVLINSLEDYSRENYKRFNLTREELFNILIGQVEREHYKQLFMKYLQLRFLDNKLMQEFFDKLIEPIIDSLTKSLVDFEPIRIKIDDFVIEELVRGIDLKNEGSFMSHCVGGYSKAVEQGSSIIARIYKQGYEFDKDVRESGFRYTCEIRFSSASKVFDIVQIRGYRNKNVEDDHSNIVYKLISEFVDKLKEDSARIKFYSENNRIKNNLLDRVFDLEPLNAQNVRQP